MLRILIAPLAALLLVQPGVAMAKKRVIKRAKPAYGNGTSQLVQAAYAPPTAYNLAVQAVQDADAWWANQGSPPPAADIAVTDNMHGATTSSAYGYEHSGRLEFRTSYLDNLNRLLNSGSLQSRRQVVAQLWGLAAHERGHNIGYEHDRGGIMDPNLAGMPGEAYAWAAEQIPQRRIIRKKGGVSAPKPRHRRTVPRSASSP